MARRSSASRTTLSLPAASAPHAPASRSIWARTASLFTTLFAWGFWITLLVGTVWGAVTLEQFVINDRRFTLVGPPDPGIPSEYFQITGATHASEQQITDVFHRDFGRS